MDDLYKKNPGLERLDGTGTGRNRKVQKSPASLNRPGESSGVTKAPGTLIVFTGDAAREAEAATGGEARTCLICATASGDSDGTCWAEGWAYTGAGDAWVDG